MDNEALRRRERLKWQCRRALLELDLVFQRFWSRQGDTLDARDELALGRLLKLDDHELWALVCGRQNTEDAELARMLECLRQT